MPNLKEFGDGGLTHLDDLTWNVPTPCDFYLVNVVQEVTILYIVTLYSKKLFQMEKELFNLNPNTSVRFACQHNNALHCLYVGKFLLSLR